MYALNRPFWIPKIQRNYARREGGKDQAMCEDGEHQFNQITGTCFRCGYNARDAEERANSPQERGIKRLEGAGFRFSNWIPAQPDADNQPTPGTEGRQTAVMVKRSRHGTEYREVDPDGSVN
jgi:hypothetical protein